MVGKTVMNLKTVVSREWLGEIKDSGLLPYIPSPLRGRGIKGEGD